MTAHDIEHTGNPERDLLILALNRDGRSLSSLAQEFHRHRQVIFQAKKNGARWLRTHREPHRSLVRNSVVLDAIADDA